MPQGRIRRIAVRTGRIAFWCLFVFSAMLGFGVTGGERIVAFRDAVGTWPRKDFRQITAEYAALGHEAMRSGVAGIPAGRFVMILRSIPGLPPQIAVNPTSDLHYRRFSQGPLSAYLHLSSEQGPGQVALFEKLASGATPTDEQVRGFLSGFKLNSPIATTPEAVASVRALLAETDPAGPFAVREVVNYTLLKPYVDGLAAAERIPANPDDMAADQQYRVLALLDDHLRSANPELWRAKQINDFLSGVWGQGYGPTYVALIDGFFVVRNAARIVAIACVLVITRALVRRRRPTPAAPTDPGQGTPRPVRS